METAPDDLKPAMNTIATVIADAVASGNNNADQTRAALTQNVVTLLVSGLTLQEYFDTNCKPPLSPPPAAFSFAHKACSLINTYDNDLDQAFEQAREKTQTTLADEKRRVITGARVSTDMTSELLRKLPRVGHSAHEHRTPRCTPRSSHQL